MMFVDFNKIFFPTKEQLNYQCEKIREIHYQSIKEKGHVCSNCKYNIYVQESPYSDRLDCKYGKENVINGCERYEELDIEEVIKQFKYNKQSKE